MLESLPWTLLTEEIKHGSRCKEGKLNQRLIVKFNARIKNETWKLKLNWITKVTEKVLFSKINSVGDIHDS